MSTEPNFLGTILNYLFGIGGILATIYFSVKYSEKKKPVYCYTTEQKIRKKLDPRNSINSGIEVRYKGKVVDEVSVTTIWFWNAGKKPIRKEDIPASSKITISIEENEKKVDILDASCRKTSRSEIQFNLEKQNLNFEFLDYLDGATLEIIHTGSLYAEVKISGVVLNCPKGVTCLTGHRARSFLYPLFATAMLPRTSSKSSFRSAGIFISFIYLIASVFLFYFFKKSGTEITTTELLLRDHLGQFLNQTDIAVAVELIKNNSRYLFLNKFMPWLFSGLLFFSSIICFLSVFKMRSMYPDSLRIKEEKEKGESPVG